jgi:biopolymer transport protein ExbD
MRSAETQRRRFDVNMTPMIDVVFLLLIFFVCTASFQLAEQILPAHLARSGSVAAQRQSDPPEELERVIVALHVQGDAIRWVVGGRCHNRMVQVRGVLQAVAQIDPRVPIILDVDGAVPLRYVVELCDLCRQLGLRKIEFAASVEG